MQIFLKILQICKNFPASLVLDGKKDLAEDEAINPTPADTLTSSPPFGNPFIRKSKSVVFSKFFLHGSVYLPWLLALAIYLYAWIMCTRDKFYAFIAIC